MKRLFTQFSFPGGIPSHVAPETPGLDPRGRRARLRALARLRRRLRQPRPDRRLRRRRRRGRDRPARDQLALQQVPEPRDRRRGPADPPPQRLQDRQSLRAGPDQPRGARPAVPRLRLHAVLRRGRTSPTTMHELMAATLDQVIGDIQRIKASAARDGFTERPRWPMIVLRTPKGWTCPKEIDGRRTEDYWRSHQVPMGEMHENPGHVAHPRGVDEELPARGAVRRRRPPPARARRRSRRRATGA